MVKVSYDLIVLEVDKLITSMALSSDFDSSCHYWNQYIFYIDACGWTDYEYDLETMRRIDLAWDQINIKKTIWN